MDILELEGVNYYVEDPYEHSKLGIINRFHRTIREMLGKYFQSYKTDRWIDVITDIIENYNTRKHRTLGCSPSEMDSEKVADLYIKLNKENEKSMEGFHSFNVGDRVRVLLKRKTFEKGPMKFSEMVYTISRIDGLSFFVMRNGVEKKRGYKYYELVKIGESEEPPERAVKPPKARSSGKKIREIRRGKEASRLEINMRY